MRPEYSEHYAVLDDKSFQIRGETLFLIVVVFSALLVFVLLFLYVRWACRYSHVSSTQAPPTMTNPTPQTQGLDASAIKGIPVISHQAAPSSDSAAAAECCICLGVFEDGEKVKALPGCCHCYHPECVDRWLSTRPRCPLCRAAFRVDSPVLKVVLE